MTGYARKYAIRLLNHLPESATQIQRPRLPIYGSEVQEALFLAWRTIQYPCAKRLVPCLPKLIPVLERDGHLQLDEEHRHQLLTMSIRTAERLLSTQRRPSPRGISTTQPGTVLKHQSKDREGERERRIYDEAKTPWQRLLLSGIFPDEIEQKWRKDVAVLDPLRLVQHVEALQRAVWRCAEGGLGTTLVRFSLDACVSSTAHVPQRAGSHVLASVASDLTAGRDWSRSMYDPFQEEWE